MHYVLHKAKGEGDYYYWTRVASNGQVLATSELYGRKHDAKRGIYADAEDGTPRLIDKTYEEE